MTSVVYSQTQKSIFCRELDCALRTLISPILYLEKKFFTKKTNTTFGTSVQAFISLFQFRTIIIKKRSMRSFMFGRISTWLKSHKYSCLQTCRKTMQPVSTDRERNRINGTDIGHVTSLTIVDRRYKKT
jgi:hypothetical protein